MELKDIKELIALMRKNDLSEFQLEQEGFRIKLKRGADLPQIVTTAMPAPLPAAALPAAPAASTTSTAAPTPEAPGEKLREIVSPMVGTFYSSPSPEAGPYVSAGKAVSEETVVCIVEAMKVMNEIKAETKGTVVEVVAESGKPVQYGQVLFRIR